MRLAMPPTFRGSLTSSALYFQQAGRNVVGQSRRLLARGLAQQVENARKTADFDAAWRALGREAHRDPLRWLQEQSKKSNLFTIGHSMRILGRDEMPKRGGKSRRDAIKQHKLAIRLPGRPAIVVSAQGPGRGTGPDAKKEAARLAMESLWTNGLFEKLFKTRKPAMKEAVKGPDLEKLNIAAIEKEKDALEHVYNYCAKHGLLPDIKLEHDMPRRGAQKAVKCTISLPKKDLSATCLTSKKYSEWNVLIATALKFKAAAEARQDSGKSAVSTDNCGLCGDILDELFKFLFLRGFEVSVEEESMDASGRRWAKVTIAIKGEEAVVGPKVYGRNKKKAEHVARLMAATVLWQQKPSLREEFTAAREAGGGKVRVPTRSKAFLVPRDIARQMQDLVEKAQKSGMLDSGVDLAPVRTAESAGDNLPRAPPLTVEEKKALSERLATKYAAYVRDPRTAELRKAKSALPMNQHKAEVSEMVQDHVYSIVVGATGSGKTTQVPQIILEQYYQDGRGAECNIICTQPRRIAATSVAGRVGQEMGPSLKDRVGYRVRFDHKPPKPGGSVTYCTTGILLQQMQSDPDHVFEHHSHIIIDEVHERDKIIDFSLAILKKAVAERRARGLKIPHVVLMSATLDTELFSHYFKNLAADGTEIAAPIVSVPGRTFPVTEHYLDDLLPKLRKQAGAMALLESDKNTRQYLKAEEEVARLGNKGEAAGVEIDWSGTSGRNESERAAPEDKLVPCGLVAVAIALTAKTTAAGAMLVFCPGLQEMQEIERVMRTGPLLGEDLSDPSRFRVYMLHSSMPDTQKTVFDPLPGGIRKIILSTNIGETSITIPDARFVIDTGKARELHYDQVTRIESLECGWISKSNAKQRAGRAGRVQDGHYLALYSRARYQSLRTVGLPELLRSDLQTTCLGIKASLRGFGGTVRAFLASAIEPPAPKKVAHALKSLGDIGAITADEKLTPLGRLLAELPIHPALGKMILLGVLFKCLDPILVIGAMAEERSIWVSAPAAKKVSQRIRLGFSGDLQSDHLADYRAFCCVRQRWLNDRFNPIAHEEARRHNLHFQAIRSIYSSACQMEDILAGAGLVARSADEHGPRRCFGGPALNANSDKAHIVKAILLAGLQPNLALAINRGGALETSSGDAARMVVSSVVGTKDISLDFLRCTLMTFTGLAESEGQLFARGLTVVDLFTAALFFPRTVTMPNKDQPVILCDNWLSLHCLRTGTFGAEQTMHVVAVIQRLYTSAFRALAEKKPLDAGKDGRVREAVIQHLVGLLDRYAEMLRNHAELRQANDATSRRSSTDGCETKSVHESERFGARDAGGLPCRPSFIRSAQHYGRDHSAPFMRAASAQRGSRSGPSGSIGAELRGGAISDSRLL